MPPPTPVLYSSLSLGTLSRGTGDIHGNTSRMEYSIHDKERCTSCGLWKHKERHCYFCLSRPNRHQANLAQHKAVRRPKSAPIDDWQRALENLRYRKDGGELMTTRDALGLDSAQLDSW